MKASFLPFMGRDKLAPAGQGGEITFKLRASRTDPVLSDCVVQATLPIKGRVKAALA